MELFLKGMRNVTCDWMVVINSNVTSLWGLKKKGLSKVTKVNRNEALMPTMTPHKCSCDHYLLKSLLLHGTEAKSRTRS